MARYAKLLHRVWCALLLCGLIGGVPSAYALEHAPIRLAIGQSMTLPVDYQVGDSAITNPKVCDYTIRSHRQAVYLNARSNGTTMLTLWDAQGVERDTIPITVTAHDLSKLAPAEGMQGIAVDEKNGQLVVHGEVDSAEALAAVGAYAKTIGAKTGALRLSRTAEQTLAKTIERSIAKPNIRVRAVQDQLLLEGESYSADEAQNAQAIAQSLAPNIVNALSQHKTEHAPRAAPLIELDVYFMEVKKSALRGLGVEWTPGLTPQSKGNGGFGDLVSSTLGFVTNLLPKLHFARERGEARILEHPNFVVKSGEQANFFSGSDVPYPSAQGVQFKEVGIKVNAEPILIGNKIDLKIDATISALGRGSTPAIDRRSITTHAICMSGESVVLAGLWNRGDATTWNRIPSREGGALVSLSRSRDFLSHHSDFLIFVQPRVTNVGARAAAAQSEWDALFHEMEANPRQKRRRGAAREFSSPLPVPPPPPEGEGMLKPRSRPRTDTDESNTAPAALSVRVPQGLLR